MVSRRLRSEPVAARSVPLRAKHIQRRRESQADSLTSCEHFVAASQAFDSACEDRASIGLVDERYFMLARAAVSLLESVVREPSVMPRVGAALEPYAEGVRRAGVDLEEDLRIAQVVAEKLRASSHGT